MITPYPRSQHWQLAPNGAGITQGADDIDLCIRHILSTRKIVLAIQTWEKRAVVERVLFSGSAPHIQMRVQWRIAAGLNGALSPSPVYTTGLAAGLN